MDEVYKTVPYLKEISLIGETRPACVLRILVLNILGLMNFFENLMVVTEAGLRKN